MKWFRFLALVWALLGCALGLRTVFAVLAMTPFWAQATYYLFFALVLLWGFSLWRYLKTIPFSLRTFLTRYGFGIGFAVLLSTLVVVTLHPELRWYKDEANTLAVSRAMFFRKTVSLFDAQSPYWSHFLQAPGNLLKLEGSIDPRNMMFPFMVSLLHILLGYSPNNIFVLNFLVMGFILSAIFICAQKAGDKRSGCAAALLTVSCPMFGITGSSGSYDLLALALLGLSFMLLYIFLRHESAEIFGCLWATLLVMMHVREESIVYFGVIVIGLALLGYIKREYVRRSAWVLAMTPWAISSWVWHRFLMGPPKPIPGDPAVFGWRNVIKNLEILIPLQWDFHFRLPFPHLLHCLGIVLWAVILFNFWISKKYSQAKSQKHFVAIVTACLTSYLMIFISFCESGRQYALGIGGRYFLIFSIACALSPVVWNTLHKSPGRLRNSRGLLSFALGAFFLYYPLTIAAESFRTIPKAQEFDYVIHFLRQQKSNHILVLYDDFETLENYGFTTLPIWYANYFVDFIFQQKLRGAFDEMIVVQTLRDNGSQWVAAYAPSSAYQLKTISERQTALSTLTRISKVIDIHAPAPEPAVTRPVLSSQVFIAKLQVRFSTVRSNTREMSVRGRPLAEPLVISGHGGAADMIGALFDSNGNLLILIDHWGSAPVISPPIKIESGKTDWIEVTLNAKGVAVSIDGIKVVKSRMPAYLTTREQIMFGENNIGGSTTGTRFSGTLLRSAIEQK